MIPIFYQTLSTTSTGRVIRCVTCESCRADYVFNFDATAEDKSTILYGMGAKSAERKAIARAQAAVESELETGIRVVPCPGCGWYQEHMVAELRNRLPRAFGTEAIGLFSVSLLMMATGLFAAGSVILAPKHVQQEESALGFWIAVASVGLILFLIGCYVIQRNMSRRADVDPNGTVPLDVRLERARTKALLHSEFVRQYPGVEVVRFPPHGG